jgi:hypothetical protein
MLILVDEFYCCIKRYIHRYRDSNAFVWRGCKSGFLNSIAMLQNNRPDAIDVDGT